MKVRPRFASAVAAAGLALVFAAGGAGAADEPATASAPASSPPARAARHGAVRRRHHTATESSAPAASSSGASGNRKLALQAPPLDHIIDRQKLRYILAYTDESNDQPMSVSVEETKAPVQVPVGQLAAIPWAFMHPTQAWRIFTPLVAQ